MIDSAILDEVPQGLVTEARTVPVGLWTLLWDLKQDQPDEPPDTAKHAVLGVVRRALLEDGLVAGQFVDRDEDTAELVCWSRSAEDIAARIDREWTALGRDPNIGDIVWFVDPKLLPVVANLHPMERGWKPESKT